MEKIKVMSIFGTRPEAIKMAPLIHELRKHPLDISSYVTVTAQHREMLDQVLDIFKIEPHFDLDIMQARQTLTQITIRALDRLEKIILEVQPHLILVHGDTTTTFAASMAAYYHQISVGHVEAGLRTYDKYSPYPEEMNRQLTGILADLHFAPTAQAAQNLMLEQKLEASIFVTGNTAIDALQTTVSQDYLHPVLEQAAGSRMILMTAHRRENLGEPMQRMFGAVRRIVDQHPDVFLVYPVHLNPLVQEAAQDILGNHERIQLIGPLDALDFHNFAARAYLILTDSGGVQEEAPSLGVPVLVLRETTERPEGVEAGTLKLVGTDEEMIYESAHELLTNTEQYERMSKASNPYGDGQASSRIVQAILYHFGKREQAPDRFKV